MFVYGLNCYGEPLMPCPPRKARLLTRERTPSTSSLRTVMPCSMASFGSQGVWGDLVWRKPSPLLALLVCLWGLASIEPEKRIHLTLRYLPGQEVAMSSEVQASSAA